MLNDWCKELEYCFTIQKFLLKLIRSNKSFQSIECHGSFYSQNLKSSIELALVRIRLPQTSGMIIPEISAGRHHIAIHFKAVQVQKNAMMTKEYVVPRFELACCN